MAQRAIRFSEITDKAIREATEKRGFASPTAFVRHAVEQELSGHKEELVTAEERLAASIDQVKGEVLAVGRAQQALFALVDSLAKILLTCIPEPDRLELESAVAKAQARHSRLLKNAGQAMGGRFEAGNARVGETWRTMRSRSFDFGRASRSYGASAALATAYKTIIHYARMSSVRKRGSSVGTKRARPYFQRCAVRVTYTKNATTGQWRAHGRYIVRESVAFDGGAEG